MTKQGLTGMRTAAGRGQPLVKHTVPLFIQIWRHGGFVGRAFVLRSTGQELKPNHYASVNSSNAHPPQREEADAAAKWLAHSGL